MNFALIGAAGYIAPRHMQAIRATGHRLVAALDPNDSVGIIDSYFPDADFFTEFERFDRHVDKMRRKGPDHKVDFVSICSPNYLHDSHIRFALRSSAHVVCEKPLVLNPWNLDALKDLERENGRDVFTILQLRLHPAIIALRDRIQSAASDRKHDVDLTYVTSRGHWYLASWKGDVKKSGGIATNIGIHFFDMLHYVFGAVQLNIVHLSSETRAAGFLEYERARVRWFLSVELDDVPLAHRNGGQRTYRAIVVDGEEVEFSDGFTDLHQRSYEAILRGEGYGLEANRVAIETVSAIRHATPVLAGDDAHPFLAQR